MRLFLKLVFIIALSSFVYAKVITNGATISYMFGDKSFSYHMETNTTIVDKSQNGDALSIRKTVQERYAEDNSSMELEVSVVVSVNRDIADLIIGDEIAHGYVYQDGTLHLNGVTPSSFLLLDSALSLSIGDVKNKERYVLTYLVKANSR